MKIFTFFVSFLALLGFGVQALWGISSLIMTFIFFSATALVLASIFRMFFVRFRTQSFSQVWQKMLLNLFAILGFCVLIIISFVVYHNYIEPAKLSNITFKNSAGQEIVFVKMSHIATEDFYQKKQKSLEDLFQKGYIILAEGAKPGSEESQKKFDEKLGIEFAGLYGKIAQILGYSHQTVQLYENIPQDSLVNVDLSLDEIIDLMGENNSQNQAIANDMVLPEFSELSSIQKKMVRIMVQAIFNFQAKSQDILAKDFYKNDSMMSVLLYKRNEPVIDFIVKNPDKNIAIVYGSLHYDGIISELQSRDNSWKIHSIEPFLAY